MRRAFKRIAIGSKVIAGIVFAASFQAEAAFAQPARATGANVASAYSGFFTLARPGEFHLTLFDGGFRSDQYATTVEGIQGEQSLTPYLSAVGRISGYQLYIGQGFDDPLDPGTGHSARFNFARIEGGLDLSPYPLTHLYILGGSDVGDSGGGIIEGDFSTWLGVYSRHPINLAFSAVYDSQNRVTDSELDLRAVMYSGEWLIAFAGAGGTIFGGGFVPGLQGEAGPALGLYVRSLKAGLDIHGGYGDSGTFVQMNLFKVFSFRD